LGRRRKHAVPVGRRPEKITKGRGVLPNFHPGLSKGGGGGEGEETEKGVRKNVKKGKLG